jgi:hypothetical protein
VDSVAVERTGNESLADESPTEWRIMFRRWYLIGYLTTTAALNVALTIIFVAK